MIHHFRSVCGVCLAVLSLAAAPAAAEEVDFTPPPIHVPAGFEVEIAAAPPLVMRPITAAFDERGRLYVADSSGSNEPVEKQLEERPHRILRLEDTDGDGRFDRRTVFADRMMFPEGTMWLDGSLYVSAPPSIWKLTDTDGDGVADRRQEWLRQTLTGCANDLHGPYAGPDGLVYWCKGSFAEQTYERPDGQPFVTRAAHIFRRRPGGGFVEPVMTGGMDNPVDVVFTPGGERIFTTTFLQHPGGGKRDGLVHAVYGGVYGKRQDAIDEHIRTGDVMPVLSHLGPAAPCGLAVYESDAFGDDYRHNLFAAQFNMNRVSRHVLEPAGATFTSRDEDFLVSDSRDFHPTDVVPDADGSLLVIDTGGWYKLCCPTSQLYKPDVLGAIYRVRRTGATAVEDPRGLRLDWADAPVRELAERLGDARPAVRRRAVSRIAERGDGAIAALRGVLASSASVEARRNVIWALTRIDSAGARKAVRAALGDEDATVRQAALHAISLWRDREALPQLLEIVRDAAPHNRRAAAEALGRIGEPEAAAALLEAASHAGGDRVLEHSLTFALIEIADAEATAAGLSADSPYTRRVALIALDQMPGGGLAPRRVIALLSDEDPVLRQTAEWIIGRHDDWSAALADVLRDEASGADVRRAILLAMAGADLNRAPAVWVEALVHTLSEGEPDMVELAVAAVRRQTFATDRIDALREALLRLARDDHRPTQLRLDALAALPGGVGRPDAEMFAFLQAHLAPERPLPQRMAASEVLAQARLRREQLLKLIPAVETAGLIELDRLLSAYRRSRDQRVGSELLAALRRSPVKASLRPDRLRSVLEGYPRSVREAGERLIEALTVGDEQLRSRLESLLASLPPGDIRRGQEIFNSPRAACFTCHAIGYQGGDLGPDLTRIGQVRSERDLLEAIVFPSASFVQSYEPVVIVTSEGTQLMGILRRNDSEGVVLAAGPGVEVRIDRGDVAEMHGGAVSLMPMGMDQVLSRRELADLIAFLKATEW